MTTLQLPLTEEVAQRTRPPHIMPLDQFDPDHHEYILWLVEEDSPPPKWTGNEMFQCISRAWTEWHYHRGVNPAKKRTPIPGWVRRAVMERDGRHCGICDQNIADGERIHLDHVVPFSHGGHDLPDNLRVAHATCNIRRGNGTKRAKVT